jgi:hypothetical protein
LDAKVDVEVDSLHVKRIAIEDLVGYVYIVRVDYIKQLYVRLARNDSSQPMKYCFASFEV